jgi:Carboxypeptidase regulatory-like domain
MPERIAPYLKFVRQRLGGTCVVFGLFLTTHSAAAQQVLGHAVRETDGSPLGEALIIMLDASGHETARAVTTASGGFDLRARAGRYRLRVQQIGQRGWEMPPFDLAAEQVFRPTIRVPDQPFELVELSASARRPNCSVTLGDASLGAKLLEAAQTALALAEAEITKARWSFATQGYRRTVPVAGPTQDSVAVQGRLAGWPIQSADPDSLHRGGFVQGDWPTPGSMNERSGLGPMYYGPDARVLFTDWFLASHCISVESKSGRSAGAASIIARFKPAKDTRKAAALQGSLEFDRGSLALRSLSFQFAERPRWAPPESAGGEIHFARLPDGAWLPVYWEMRAPIPKLAGDGQSYRFFGVLEVGGRVTAIRGADGQRDPRAEAALHGSK